MCIGWDKCSTPRLICLPIVTTDLEEAEAPICHLVQHEPLSWAQPGNSIALPVLTLCKQARLKRYHFSDGGGGGTFWCQPSCSVIMCTDKRPASGGKQMRRAFELLVKPCLIHLCLFVCVWRFAHHLCRLKVGPLPKEPIEKMPSVSRRSACVQNNYTQYILDCASMEAGRPGTLERLSGLVT